MTTDLHCVVVSGQHPDHLGTVTTTSGRSNPNAYWRALLGQWLDDLDGAVLAERFQHLELGLPDPESSAR
jgi:hypothetical protein